VLPYHARQTLVTLIGSFPLLACVLLNIRIAINDGVGQLARELPNPTVPYFQIAVYIEGSLIHLVELQVCLAYDLLVAYFIGQPNQNYYPLFLHNFFAIDWGEEAGKFFGPPFNRIVKAGLIVDVDLAA